MSDVARTSDIELAEMVCVQMMALATPGATESANRNHSYGRRASLRCLPSSHRNSRTAGVNIASRRKAEIGTSSGLALYWENRKRSKMTVNSTSAMRVDCRYIRSSELK